MGTIQPVDWQIPTQHLKYTDNETHTSTHGRRRQGPVPQARLVARRWLVHSAEELEGKHRCCHGCHAWNHRIDVERQRGEGVQTQDARARSIRTFEILVEADHRTREGTEGG